MIHQCQISEASAGKFKALLEDFYGDLLNVSRLLNSVSPSSSRNQPLMPNRTET